MGYASEAAAACLYYGFNTLRLPLITGRAHVDNIASLKILVKIGMQYVRDELIDDCPVKTFEAANHNPQ
jgi:RimJ/RimL family protein N-acetyltransferase